MAGFTLTKGVALELHFQEWTGFDSESEIEGIFIKETDGNGSSLSTENVIAGLVFSEGFGHGKEFSYKIRFHDKFRNTRDLFPENEFRLTSFDRHGEEYRSTGFLGMQILVDKAIIEVFGNTTLDEGWISLQAFPFPSYVRGDDIEAVFKLFVPTIISVGFIFAVTANIKGIVGEKETGIKELMKMLGVPNWVQLLGWMISSMIALTLTVTIIILLLFVPFDLERVGVVRYGNPLVWWLFLMVFSFSATSMCFFISSFFQKPTLAAMMGIIIWVVSHFGVVLPLDAVYWKMYFYQKICLSLLPSAGLTYAFKIIAEREGKGIGLTWSNLFTPVSSVNDLSVGLILLTMMVSSFLYLSLTLYFENIIPSEYGVRKPWYYIFKVSTWRGSKNTSAQNVLSSFENCSSSMDFETDPMGLIPGIDIQELRKHFGSKKAVNGVSLKLYEGQVTALLGHNGAGKTTTIAMLTGFIGPSSGTVQINGFDIIEDTEAVHANLGLCPQHNMLFEELTVTENLLFFAMLKGISRAGGQLEAEKIMERLQLTDKRTTLPALLSGGQKRKLSLGIALVGDAKVIILDEPTSGMDPEARRAIWDVLLELRHQKTILLTTHFMEEADYLGDRIAIMSEGQVKCCGSPSFLKRRFGVGYTLNFTVMKEFPTKVILAAVQTYLSSASWKSDVSPSSSEIAISLPFDSCDASKFPAMFSELYRRKAELGILTIGIMATTMDDVFIKVAENKVFEEIPDDLEMNIMDGDAIEKEDNLLNSHDKMEGCQLIFHQFRAMLIKRAMYSLRKKRLIISQLLLPVILVIVGILITNMAFIPRSHPSLRISLESYPNPITLYSTDDEVIGRHFSSIAGKSGKRMNSSASLEDQLLEIGGADVSAYRSAYIVAAEFKDSKVKAMYSPVPIHSAPLSINLVSNTLLKKYTSKDYSIHLANHPFHPSGEMMRFSAFDSSFAIIIPITFAMIIPIGLSLAAASFAIFPIEERITKAKQLQLMTGVHPLVYWGANICWDMLFMLILIFVILICFPIFESHNIFSTPAGLGTLFTIYISCGFAVTSFSYLVSFFATSTTRGFVWITTLHIAAGTVLCIFVFFLDTIRSEYRGKYISANIFRMITRIFPTIGAALGTLKFSQSAVKNSICRLIPARKLESICGMHYTLHSLRSCCANCEEKFQPEECYRSRNYLTWHYDANRLDSAIPGIGQEVLIMIVAGFLFQMLICIAESGVVKGFLSRQTRNKDSVVKNIEGDDDVEDEKQEIETFVAEGRVSNEGMVVTNLSKSFGSFAAVSNLSFRIHRGECFGLLGVNGAGKTTTFRMLTGDEIPSSGDAFASRNTLSGNRNRFLASIGYCPQFDGIIGVLTGMEMVELFCRIRGVQTKCVNQEAKKWMDRLGLTESMNVQCRKYSGGMKRRLSVAMALVGDPPVIMLDEPTSGVDPVARRQFWKIIREIRASGQAVILTSHSVMVNGQMQCLGGVEHLKHKYAQGYTLNIKLVASVDAESSEVEALKMLVEETFNNCKLKDKHQNNLVFQIGDSTIPWDRLFQSMEDVKNAHKSIVEDCSVNATTLEDIFLSFARKSYADRVTDKPWYKRLI